MLYKRAEEGTSGLGGQSLQFQIELSGKVLLRR